MRIAVEASTWINRRGYGRFTRELVRALLRLEAGHDFVLVLDSGAGEASDLPPIEHRVVATRRPVVDAAGAEGARSLGDIWRMSRALSAGEFDAVIFPTVYSFAPVRSRARVVVVIHDALPERWPDLVLGSVMNRLRWRLKRDAARRRADVLATVSEASAADIRDRLPVGETPVLVLTEGAAPVFRPEPLAGDREAVEAAIGGTGPYLLYVGGFSPHKRVPHLVRAFGTIAPSHPALRLVLVGPTDDPFASDLAEVRRVRGALGDAAPRVVLTGYVSDETLAALYRHAICAVLPSMAEGFGLPAVEAMACGAPVVVSRTEALEQLCGEAGLYLDEIEQLGPVLSRVVGQSADGAWRRACAQAGLQQAQRHGWDAGARRLLEAVAC